MKKTLFTTTLLVVLLAALTGCTQKKCEFLTFIEGLNCSNPVALEKAVPEVRKFFQSKIGEEITEFDGMPCQIWPQLFTPIGEDQMAVPFQLHLNYQEKYHMTLCFTVKMPREEVEKLDMGKIYNVIPKNMQGNADMLDIQSVGNGLWIDKLYFDSAKVTPWKGDL